ncbi:MAG: ribosome assembly cofactor RimP [Bacteroidales bacterium]|nr:ribosome assembly cofactor RimP [Bacteroidales bacterium]
MNVSDIIDAIGDEIVARNCFIVDISISRDNDITVTIESETGQIELDDCVSLSRFFETKFDRETEDYSLTVSSAGLDQPFKVHKQFVKALGSKVEVQLKGGRKMIATLVEAKEDSISLKYSVKEAVEGKKKKELVEHIECFALEQVNSVRPYIEF